MSSAPRAFRRPSPLPGDGSFRRARPRRLLGLVVALGCMILPHDSSAQAARAAAAPSAATPTELDNLKAGFVLKFLSFVEWPAAALAPGEEFRLAVVAPPAIFKVVADSLKGKKIGTRPLAVLRLDPYPPATEPRPHAVFVHQNAAVRPAVLLAHYREQPVLIVGDAPDFVADGGMIGLLLRSESLRFQISLAAASRAGLQISSQLSALAEIVKEPAP